MRQLMTCVFITSFVLCCIIACTDEKPEMVPLPPPAPIVYEPPPHFVVVPPAQQTGRITDHQLDHLEGQLEWLKRRLPDKGPPK